MNRCCCVMLALIFPGHDLSADELTVVHAGWLLAVPGKPPVDRQSIVIEDGRIVKVSAGFVSRAELGDKGAGAEFIDLSQAFVLPGLIDAHVHLASSPLRGSVENAAAETEAELALAASRNARLTLQAGFTTVVDLGAVGIPGHENAIFAVRDAVRDGTLAGPRILAAGSPVAATGLERADSYRDEVASTMAMHSVCDGADDCRRAVRHQVKRGSDIIVFFNTGSLLAEQPVSRTMSDLEMRAIVETAHALGRKVIADGHHASGIAAADRAGADILDSLHLYDDQTFESLRKDVFVQSHIHGILQAVGETSETLRDGLWGWLPYPLLMRFQAIRQRPFAMITAYERGIRNLAYASDAGVYAWGENAHDLVEFVKRGIPAGDAILFATLNPARMLGLEADLGSIEAGKKADMIATRGSPLDDVTEVLRVRFVIRDGIVYRQNAEPATASFSR
jgi:imidazolonepropionase-like amidohydrolase